VSPVHLFALAAQHAQWASVRQAVVTGNIANANTPGYGALDVEPFSAVFNDTALTMARTAPDHFALERAGASGSAAGGWDVEDTGASVALDQELIKADEVNRAFAPDTSVMRSFHRMLMASLRSGA
jgi:flagellar basal-body rod protein FlgB